MLGEIKVEFRRPIPRMTFDWTSSDSINLNKLSINRIPGMNLPHGYSKYKKGREEA